MSTKVTVGLPILDYSDVSGVPTLLPADNCKATFLAKGTNTLIRLWTSYSSELPNPIDIMEGYFWYKGVLIDVYATESYQMIVTNAQGTLTYTVEVDIAIEPPAPVQVPDITDFAGSYDPLTGLITFSWSKVYLADAYKIELGTVWGSATAIITTGDTNSYQMPAKAAWAPSTQHFMIKALVIASSSESSLPDYADVAITTVPATVDRYAVARHTLVGVTSATITTAGGISYPDGDHWSLTGLVWAPSDPDPEQLLTLIETHGVYTTATDSTAWAKPTLFVDRILALHNWLTSFTSATNDENDGKYMISSNGLVKNASAFELGRGGYFAPSSSTSESQILLIRGYIRAFQSTGKAVYWTKAVWLMDALIKYFFYGIEAPANATEGWYSHWIVNGGRAFLTQGPKNEDASAWDGVVAGAVSFVNGEAIIGGLSKIYMIFTTNGTLSWNNVFANLVTGSEYHWLYWYDADGYKYDANGNYANDHAPSMAGRILLDYAYTGDVLMNYATFTTTYIPYGDQYECWPMWRDIVKTGPDKEWNLAGDSLHWYITAFQLGNDVAPFWPDKAVWARRVAAMKYMWDTALLFDLSTYAFKAEIGKSFDSWPLTYWLVSQGGAEIAAPNPAYMTAYRDTSGNVTFPLPVDATRTLFQFTNENVYVDYIRSATTLFYEISCSVASTVHIQMIDADTTTSQITVNVPAGTAPIRYSVPMASILNVYHWGYPVDLVVTWDGTNWRSSTPADAYAPVNDDSGFGWGGHWVTPPSITYFMPDQGHNWGTAIEQKWQLRITDNHGTRVYQDIPYESGSGTWYTVTVNWVDANHYPIQNIEFILREQMDNIDSYILVRGFVGANGGTTSGTINTVRITVEGIAANTVKVGDMYFSGASRTPIKYSTGALPFQTSSNSPSGSGSGSGSANFQGPYLAGYQNPVPYFAAGEWSRAQNMLTMVRDCQDSYLATNAVDGPVNPYAYTYAWDSAMFGEPNTVGANGPDPNGLLFGGFQYRPFQDVSEYLYLVKNAGNTDGSVVLAENFCNRFLAWLNTWLTANPGSVTIPTDFTTVPTVVYTDPGQIALALKGAIWMIKAKVNVAKALSVAKKLWSMLKVCQVPVGSAYTTMIGSFAADASEELCYGYVQAECMDALAMAKASGFR